MEAEQSIKITENKINQEEKLTNNKTLITEDPYIKFDRLTKKNGLSSNYILDILQDNYGFLWIATIDGLNRYDGYKIKQYKHFAEDSASIADNLVTCLKEDSGGGLWIGTRKGLNLYNRNNDSFENVARKNDDGDLVEINNYIRAILPDENNILWIETVKGELIKYNCLLKTSTIYHHQVPTMADTYFYHDLYKDKNGILWLGGRFMGIYSFDPKTDQFYIYMSDENDSTKKRENDVAKYFLDSHDKMWLAGIDGLYTLNTKTEIFTKIFPTSTFSIVEDKNKKLWFGTGAGIYVYDLLNYSFTFMNKNDNNPNSLIHDHINKIYIDNAQNVWIGTIEGISIYKPSKNKFRHIYHITGDERTPISSNTTALLQLKTDEIWIGTDNSGIDCMNDDFIKNDCYNYSKQGKNKINSNRISVLAQDTDGDVWAGQWSGRGFNIINPVTHAVKSYSFLKNSFKADWYNDIFEDSKGNFWLGIWGAQGLYQFDKKRGTFKDQTYLIKNIFPSGPIKNLAFDGDYVWIGLQNQSIFIALNPKTKKIANYLKNNYSSYDFNRILKIYNAHNGDVWFQTNKGVFHKQNNPYISIIPVNNFPELSFLSSNLEIPFQKSNYKIDTVISKVIDQEGDIWIGTFKGLFRIRDNKVIHSYSVKSHQGLISDTIWSMAFVPPNQLWLGTEKGFCELNIGTEKFDAFVFDPRQYLSSHLIKCIAEDENGKIWVGTTDKGLNQIDPLTQKVKQFNSDLNNDNSFWGDLVNCIYIDKIGTVWIGGHGLNKYNQDSDSFIHFTETDGLADNGVMSIQEDEDGMLWIATLNGLSVFDPVNKTFQNYYEKDGLQDNEFTNANCKLKSGELLFGGKNGINVCDPSKLFINNKPPKLAITAFSVFDEEKDIDTTHSKPIELKYNENYFSFEYTALDFSNPEHIQYAYKLENADKDWIFTDAVNRTAKYTNIDPGNYRFKLRGSNGDGTWSESTTFIDLIIKPPFWKTIWFIILEVLFLFIIIIIIVKYREKKIIEKNQFQLLEQKLLRSQMNPHFIFNSLSSIQSFIFENNPLEAGSYLSRFAELIRSILYNSREEFITIEKEIKTLQNYLDLQQLRYDNKFDYKLNIDPLIQTDLIQIPPMLAQPFIENSIEHGIKHLKGKGFISISCTLMPEKNSILLIIQDNGIGIKASRKLENEKSKNHTSLATIIANERLDIFNKGLKKKQFIMEINDIKDDDGKVNGTKVKFIIPFRKL
ncbi:MAG: histidine kinase [Bacteroidales bacterium]|nr:histidine kinase [Bacteroidales bacterium]